MTTLLLLLLLLAVLQVQLVLLVVMLSDDVAELCDRMIVSFTVGGSDGHDVPLQK